MQAENPKVSLFLLVLVLTPNQPLLQHNDVIMPPVRHDQRLARHRHRMVDSLDLWNDLRKCSKCHQRKGPSHFLHKTRRDIPGVRRGSIFTKQCLLCRNQGEEDEDWEILNHATGRPMSIPNNQNNHGPVAGPLPAEAVEDVADHESDRNSHGASPAPVLEENPDVVPANEVVAGDEPDRSGHGEPVPAENPDVVPAAEQDNDEEVEEEEVLGPDDHGQIDGEAKHAARAARKSDITELFVFEAGALAVAIGGSLLAYWTFDPMLPL